MLRKPIRVSHPIRLGLKISLTSLSLFSIIAMLFHLDTIINHNKDLDTRLYYYVKDADVEATALALYRGADINQDFSYNNSGPPLSIAVEDDSYSMVFILLRWGAGVNQQRLSDGRTPLHLASEGSGQYHLKIVQLLLRHHANPNLRDKGGYTSLDLACLKNHKQVIELLRKAGAKTGQELASQPTEARKPLIRTGGADGE